MNSLLIKLALMPTVIAFVTLASRKWGNSIGGILGGFPWVAGPIIVFIALENGVEFAAGTIPGVMVGTISWLGFIVIYSISGQSFNPILSTLIGYVGYTLIGFLIQPFTPLLSLHVWFLLAIVMMLITLRFFPKVKPKKTEVHQKLSYEIPMRMFVITIFVVGITYFAEMLGPTWSGILTPFPVMTTVLAIFTHYTQGIVQVRKVFLGIFTGFFGFTAFLYSQAFLLLSTSIFNSVAIGIALDLIITLGMQRILSKKNII